MKRGMLALAALGCLALMAFMGSPENYFFTSVSGECAGTGTADTTYIAITPELAGANFLEAHLSCGAPSDTDTTPTMDVAIQSSMDGTNYDNLQTFTQATTDAVRERKTLLRTTSTHFGRWWRVKVDVATSTGTTTYTPTVRLIAGKE